MSITTKVQLRVTGAPIGFIEVIHDDDADVQQIATSAMLAVQNSAVYVVEEATANGGTPFSVDELQDWLA